MKNIRPFVWAIGASLTLWSCQTEPLPMVEQIEQQQQLNLIGPGDEEIFTEQDCATLTTQELPTGLVSLDQFASEGVTLLAGPDGFPNSYSIVDDTNSCWGNTKGITVASTDDFSRPPFLIGFAEGHSQISIMVSVPETVHQKVVLTAYSSENGEGTVVGTDTFEPGTYNNCGYLVVEGEGIFSARITSEGTGFSNNFLVKQIIYCTINDVDGDGVNDAADNCPLKSNPLQEDSDNDNIGNTCDLDGDNDGIEDDVDNCLFVSNPTQANSDGDENGDACDSDDDNDGIEDTIDSVGFSNTEVTVHIGTCDSGVPNNTLSNGVFMSDLIDELETGEYKNLGQTIRSFNDLMNSWVNQGVITGEQKTLILNCAISQN